jgi:putative glycerol-1-phosphate prenyltransferase
MSIYQKLLEVKQKKGAGYLLLIDPDRKSISELVELAKKSEENGVDAILIGSSLIISDTFEETVKTIKENIKIPIILFPGSTKQVSKYADAILFLSLISGRNATHLIGDHVVAAPLIKKIGIEPISTGYMLIESGKTTSAEFMSNTQPIPRDKPDIAMAHALAAEYLGMKMVYFEAGSGALNPVPDEMITFAKKFVTIPIIVGGGIKTPEIARQKVSSGADFIVTGNIMEKSESHSLIKEFADAVHIKI